MKSSFPSGQFLERPFAPVGAAVDHNPNRSPLLERGADGPFQESSPGIVGGDENDL